MGSCKKEENLGNPGLMSEEQESIFNLLLMTAGSVMGGAFIIKSLIKEKNPIWGLIGWFGVSGAWFGALRGIAGILHHFAINQPKAQQREETDNRQFTT